MIRLSFCPGIAFVDPDVDPARIFLACDDLAHMTGVRVPTMDGLTLSRVAMFFQNNFPADYATDGKAMA